MESGYYPAGAEYDPRAPWNQEEPHMVKCEACNGQGHYWFAYNIKTGKETECSEQTWLALPETEEEAIAHDGFLVKGESEVCTVCDGTGEVEYEDDYEPDYDDDWR